MYLRNLVAGPFLISNIIVESPGLFLFESLKNKDLYFVTDLLFSGSGDHVIDFITYGQEEINVASRACRAK